MLGMISFFKSLAITFAIIFLMQIRLGESTLEEKAMFWVHDSFVTSPIQEAAEGAALLVRDTWKMLTKNINTKFKKSVEAENQPGFRDIRLKLERSQAFVEEQARKAAAELQRESENSVE